MKKIETLKALLDELPNCGPTEFVALADDLSIGASELEEYAFWSEETYTRNCVIRSEEYELILLCWEEGQQTSVHNHSDQECWVFAVEGEFSENRYELVDDELVVVSESQFSAGSKSYMNDELGYHDLKNSGQGRAMSLHLYVKPIDSCEIYDEELNQFYEKELHYDSINGILLQPVAV